MKLFFRNVLVVGLLFCSLNVSSTGRYVATNGNDTGPGTEAQPWKTVRHAGATAVAGDTVYIREGIYNDMLIVRNSGTPSNPIVFTSYPAELAVIDGTGQEIYSEMNWLAGLRRWHGAVDMYNVSWIEIRGLKIQNMTLGNGIFIQKAHHLVIEDNIIDNTFNSAIGSLTDGVEPDPTNNTKEMWPPDTTKWNLSTNIIIRNNDITRSNNGGWSECISLSGVDTFEISGNHLHGNLPGVTANFWGGGGENIDCKGNTRNGKIFNNRIHNSRRIGIYLDAWDGYVHNIEIFNNLCYDLELGAGIAITSENGGKVSNIKVYNNIIHHCKDGIIIPDPNKKPEQAVTNVDIYNNTVVNNGAVTGAYLGGYGFKMDNDQVENIRVINNVFLDNVTEQMNVHSSVPTAEYTLDNNLVFPYRAASGNSRKGTNPIESDPLFVNQSGIHYYPLAGSPIIDVANNILVASQDYLHEPRPFNSLYDIGAYEYTGPDGGGDSLYFNDINPEEGSQYEAEHFTSQSGTTIEAHGQASGGYMVDYGGNGTWIEWDTINEVAGKKLLYIRYFNGSTGNRPCDIIVNGTLQTIVLFVPAGADWATPGLTMATLTLIEGNNTIRIRANSSAGGPNIDKMNVFHDPNPTSIHNAFNMAGSKDIKIYPNPASQIVTLGLGTDSKSLIGVYSLQGRLLFNLHSTTANPQIFVGDLHPGLYFIRVENEHGIFNKSFMVIK